MKVVIGSDHAGFQLKNAMGVLLTSLGHQVVDVGAYNENPSDYPDFAEAVGKAVLDGRAERGVLICGSGVGATVAANKVRGIRAGMCTDTYSAHQGVEHDNINVLVLGSRITGEKVAEELVRSYMGAKFTNEERHVRRLAKVQAPMEQRLQLYHQRIAELERELAAKGQENRDLIEAKIVLTRKRLEAEQGKSG